MTEIWREVPGWPDYAVSDQGAVKRIVKPRSGRGRIGAVLRWRRSKPDSYPTVSLTCDGHATNWRVHRLVMHAFVGPCPDGQEVNHIDGDKQRPWLINLEYVSRSQNIVHAFRAGLRRADGENNSRAKLTVEDVARIKGEYTGAYGQCAALARRFGVSHASIQDIVHGRHWADVIAA